MRFALSGICVGVGTVCCKKLILCWQHQCHIQIVNIEVAKDGNFSGVRNERCPQCRRSDGFYSY